MLFASGTFLLAVTVYQQTMKEISRARICKIKHRRLSTDYCHVLKFAAVMLFYLFNASLVAMYVRTASKWRVYMTKWAQLNKNFRTLLIVDMKARKTEIRIFALFFGFFLTFNIAYLLFLLKSFSLVPSCIPDREPDVNYLEFVFYNLFPEFSKIVPPNVFIGIYFVYVDYCMTYAGVFGDSMVVVLSLTLSRKFELLNEKLSINMNVSRKSLVAVLATRNFKFLNRTNRTNSGLITLLSIRN